ncbi:hypothetical protein [Streptomyces sp. NPDC014995]|uniref:hypothetical protein n=1 Tax=Streptomyces sp. NPDC014995 TaxID=3364936 RepID=UPI0036F76D4E
MRWARADPAEPTAWRPGTRLLTSPAPATLPAPPRGRPPGAYREMLAGPAERRPPRVEEYRLTLRGLP